MVKIVSPTYHFNTSQNCHQAAQHAQVLLLLGRTAAPAETYYGDRTSDAFFAWMGHEHKILSAEQAAAKAAEGNAPTPAAADGTGDAAAPIRMHARGSKGVEGCMMEGSLRVKRVPVRIGRHLIALLLAWREMHDAAAPERTICDAFCADSSHTV